jgi:hypothetical protein
MIPEAGPKTAAFRQSTHPGGSMANVQRASEIRGKTMLFTWNDGPTKGKTYEHVFHQDGTVDFHAAGESPKGASQPGAQPAGDKPEYAAEKLTDGLYAVSYLSPQGYTLTTVLNFDDHRMVGFASSAKDWFPVHGTFEVLG